MQESDPRIQEVWRNIGIVEFALTTTAHTEHLSITDLEVAYTYLKKAAEQVDLVLRQSGTAIEAAALYKVE